MIGPRVALRRRGAGDIAEMHRAVTDALAHLRPWMAWATHDYDLGTAAANAVRSEQAWDCRTAFAYAIRLGSAVDAPLVGACELRPARAGAMELGYWLHPMRTGKGLATEAAGLLVAQAFALPGVWSVEIWHDAANVASSGVPRRLGFTEVARQTPPREPLTPGEVGVDVVWRLTRPTS